MPSSLEGSHRNEPVDGLRRVRLDGVTSVVYAKGEELYRVADSLGELLANGRAGLEAAVAASLAGSPVTAELAQVLAPVDDQEVWASGVTYQRSRAARMSESVTADVYDRVYDAERPELFLKSPGWRVAAPGMALRIRRDSNWDVPEPELGLVVSAGAEIVGYVIADDMSSRQIEGENPLYLPQAKVYEDALGLSDTIVLAGELPGEPADLRIRMSIERAGQVIFAEETSTATMYRTFAELVEYLFAELSHPRGAVLITGTGIVPPDEITLKDGDEVEIAIDGLGTLRHGVYVNTGSSSRGAAVEETTV